MYLAVCVLFIRNTSFIPRPHERTKCGPMWPEYETREKISLLLATCIAAHLFFTWRGALTAPCVESFMILS